MTRPTLIALRATAKPQQAESSPRGRVLVVDDHDQIRGLLVRHFEDNRYEALAESDASRVRDAVLRWRPQLAVVDVQMPPHERFFALRELAALMPGVRPRVIAMSGSDEAAIRDVSIQLGADAFMLKPWDIDELTQMVEELTHPGAAGAAEVHSLA